MKRTRTEKSQKRTKFLLLLIVLTAILSITATYAWFSTQRDVEIVGMRLNVEVAESMQISLDGEKWTQSIQIANMRQFYGTYTGTGDGFTIYQAKKIDASAGTGNNNYVPTELFPVSSAGEVVGGKLQLVTGTFTNGGLEDVTLCSETDLDTVTTSIGDRQGNNTKHPYLVFDMYLRSISANTAKDNLILDQYSNVYVNTTSATDDVEADDAEQEGKGVGATGLEYSARVGMIVYGNTIPVTEEGDVGAKVRALTSTSTDTAAIWEPNAKEHTPYVLKNSTVTIAADGSVTTLGIKSSAAQTPAIDLSADDLKTAGTHVVSVNTMKPAYNLGITSESGTTADANITDVNGANVGLAPNAISKVRVYVWLEGQDPDCVDLASTGDKLNITLKLDRASTATGSGNTYVD